MLAKGLTTILPPLTLEEALETTKTHSIVGLLKPGQALVTRRPFRTPHHTASEQISEAIQCCSFGRQIWTY
jgi:magnesium chelatase family protein